MSATAVIDRTFEVADVSGQKVVAVTSMPPEATVSDLVHSLIGRMRLPGNDAAGRPLTYHARHDGQGRHLLGSEQVADVVEPGDRLVLQPNVDAGGRPCDAPTGS